MVKGLMPFEVFPIPPIIAVISVPDQFKMHMRSDVKLFILGKIIATLRGYCYSKCTVS